MLRLWGQQWPCTTRKSGVETRLAASPTASLLVVIRGSVIVQRETGFTVSMNRSGKVAESSQEFFNVGQLVKGIHSDEDDRPRLVHDKCRALADPWDGSSFPQDAKLLRDFGVRVEVGAEWNLDRANFPLSPRDMTRDRIDADVQNLGIEGREFFAARIEFRYLHGSSRRPVQGMESDHEILLSQVIARTDGELHITGNGG